MDRQFWTVVIIHAVFHVGCCVHGCNFGPSCPFPCMCADHRPCDPYTGSCDPGQCVTATPASYGWAGYGCLTGNVACGKAVQQNGGNHSGDEYAAENAIDGLLAQKNVTANDSAVCAQVRAPLSVGTNCSFECGNAWWQVDLGGLYQVQQVIVHNTYFEHDKYKLRNVDIRVSNVSDLGSYHYELCGWIPVGGLRPNILCHTPRVGRYVTLFKYEGMGRYGDRLGEFTACEVIITGNLYNDCTNCTGMCTAQYGCVSCPLGFNTSTLCNKECEEGYYGSSCQETCGQCVDINGLSTCDKQNGTCYHGCQIWWISDTCTTEIAPINLVPSELHLLERGLTTMTLSWSAATGIPGELVGHYGYKVQKRVAISGDWTTANRLDVHVNGSVYRETLSGLTLNTVYDFRVVPYRVDRGHMDDGTAASLARLATLCGDLCEAPEPNGQGASGTCPTPSLSKSTDDCSCGNWPMYLGIAVSVLVTSVIINIVVCVMLRKKQTSNFQPRIHFRNERSAQRSAVSNRTHNTAALNNNVPIMRTHERAVENDYMINLEPARRTTTAESSSSSENDDTASLDMLGDAPLPPVEQGQEDEYVGLAAPSEQYEQIY